MGWESFDVVRFGPLLKVKQGYPNLKVLITHLLLVLDVNQPIENHGLGIFWI